MAAETQEITGIDTSYSTNPTALFAALTKEEKQPDQVTKESQSSSAALIPTFSTLPSFLQCVDHYMGKRFDPAKNRIQSYQQLKEIIALAKQYPSSCPTSTDQNTGIALCALLTYLIQFLEAGKKSMKDIKRQRGNKLLRFVVAGLLCTSGLGNPRQCDTKDARFVFKRPTTRSDITVRIPTNSKLPDQLNKDDLFVVIDALVARLQVVIGFVYPNFAVSHLGQCFTFAAPFIDLAFKKEHEVGSKVKNKEEVTLEYDIIKRVLTLGNYGAAYTLLQNLYQWIKDKKGGEDLRGCLEHLLENLIDSTSITGSLQFSVPAASASASSSSASAAASASAAYTTFAQYQQEALQLMVANRDTYVSRHTLTLIEQMPHSTLDEQRQYYSNIWAVLEAIFSVERAPEYCFQLANVQINPASALTHLLASPAHPDETRRKLSNWAVKWNNQLFAYASSHPPTEFEPSMLVTPDPTFITFVSEAEKAAMKKQYDEHTKSAARYPVDLSKIPTIPVDGGGSSSSQSREYVPISSSMLTYSGSPVHSGGAQQKPPVTEYQVLPSESDLRQDGEGEQKEVRVEQKGFQQNK